MSEHIYIRAEQPIDDLFLHIVPRSPVLAIFVLTTDNRSHYPLRMRAGVMISVNVSVIHNHALEFYRANTSCAAYSSMACAVDDLYLHIVL